jgi:hypothetical protein
MSPRIEKFRIAWKSLLTNAKGHGSYCFYLKSTAENFAFSMNNEMPLIFHWVEKKVKGRF